MYADLPRYKDPADLYTSIIPDITVLNNNKAYILELTCCYEKNLDSSKLLQNKLQKYSNPSASYKLPLPFAVHIVEVSCLGFIPAVNLNRFCRAIGIPLPAHHHRADG